MNSSNHPKTAVVVGALGVIGRYIIDRLAAEPDWNIIGLSRRTGVDRDRVRYVPVDLLAPFDLCRLQKAHPGVDFGRVTHIFYAAFQAAAGKASGYAENIAPNRDMLVNSVSAIGAASSRLERVVLVTGTKYYGTHLGPFKTPARDSDRRHAGANYYFDKITCTARAVATHRVHGRQGTAMGLNGAQIRSETVSL
jgi:nucleoside-diphosphate-sugar epimerase